MLCDGAQVAGDKLFVLGGGWQTLRSSSLPFSHLFGLAIGVLVTPVELDRDHMFRAELKSDISGAKLWDVEGTFRQSMKQGQPEQGAVRLLMAANIAATFEATGPYSMRFLIDGNELAKTTFEVVAPTSVSPANAN
jgi:hypothetical protein